MSARFMLMLKVFNCIKNVLLKQGKTVHNLTMQAEMFVNSAAVVQSDPAQVAL
jgi:hypothetical protein